MIKEYLTKKLNLFLFVCLSFVLLTLSVITYTKNGIFIHSDGFHYYQYLPEFFLNHNFHYHNKYPIGTAICELPFFLFGCLISIIFKLQFSAGIATQFHLLINICGIFYYTLGTVFLYKTLKFLFTERTSCITILCISLGTFLYYYATKYSSYSHIYSYSLISIFLYMVILQKNKSLLENFLFGIIFGIIFLIRNENIVIGLVYLLNFEKNISSAKKHLKSIVSLNTIIPKLIGVFVSIFPQLIIWYMATGKFLSYSYADESFRYVTNPKIIEVLFSDAKGLFIFSPILIFSVFGFFVMKHSTAKNYLLSSVIIIVLKIYIVAAWWCWWLGCGMGIRSLIDILPLFAISMGSFFHYIFINTEHLKNLLKTSIRFFFLIIATMFCFINLIMYIGEEKGIISNNLSNYHQLKTAFFGIQRKISTLQLNEPIFFYGSQNNSRNYALEGLSGPENNFTWTNGKTFTMKAQLENFSHEQAVHVVLNCYHVFNGSQKVKVCVNKTENLEFYANDGFPLEFDFYLKEDGKINLHFEFPNAISPKELGLSEDPRKLALAISSITFTQLQD